jgi:hypothetical protein
LSGRPKKEKKLRDAQSKTTVRDLAKSLRGVEQILQTSGNQNQLAFINELREILGPYGSVDSKQFLHSLKNSLSMIHATRKESGKLQEQLQIDMENVSLNELKDLVSSGLLSKEKLLAIGKSRFGLSIGTLRKMKKERIQDQIQGAIQNIETLEAIKRKASE